VLDCDGSICIPCQGTSGDCDTGPTTVQACDDGNPCTINDMETILNSDGSICVPCSGIAAPCGTDGACEVTLPCDDNDPCTINDVEIQLLSDGSICVPCTGEMAPCDTDASCETEVPCDDGDPCTVDDMETILNSDGSICIPCEGLKTDCSDGPTTTQACNDGDPTTINDMETVLDCDGSICIPCQGQVKENVFIPNVFSPNGDGINDYFMINAGPEVSLVRTFRVFDRWGSALFSESDFLANDIQFAWNGQYRGQQVSPGVYVYFVEIEFTDGHKELLSGEITVVR
ncbi:MAG: gliding motility-associated C-terminal domain-containing protein, partial [Saprospiraceae bacterium]|nr:gliding motility-associated C-terminal domain-containing protein [Saprospiraceae bacterium]